MNKKNFIIFSLVCLVSLIIVGIANAATFTDFFLDGDYTSNPTWQNRSGNWTAGANILQDMNVSDASHFIYSNFSHDSNYYEINYSFNLNVVNNLQNFFFLWEGNYTDDDLTPNYRLRFRDGGAVNFEFKSLNGTTHTINGSITWTPDTNWHDVIINKTDQNFSIYFDAGLIITATTGDPEVTSADSIGISVNDIQTPGIYYDNFTMESAEETVILGVSIALNSPGDNTLTSDDPITFNTTVSTADEIELQNATLFLWYDNLTILNDTITNSISGNVSNTTTFDVSNISADGYVWNVYGCQGNGGDLNCSFATTNLTFSWIPFSTDAESHNASVLETSFESFFLNITTTTGYTVQNGRLVYNGTSFDNADQTDLGGGSFGLTQTIEIPLGTEGFSAENRTFFWNITVTEEATGDSSTFLTSTYNQTINELIFGLCGGSLDIALVNFSLFDEENSTLIDSATYPTTFQATFNFGAFHDNKIKNYSITNLSMDRQFYDFCTNTTNYTIYTNMEALYGAQSYADKNYFLTNASLTNDTNEINLYLINESNAIEFFIDVEQDLSPVTSAKVNIQKYFVGEGVYKTVEIDETSSDRGAFTAYLDLDKKYKFIISKGGEVVGTVIKTASCKEAPCELTLGLSSDLPGLYEKYYDLFAQNVLYNLSWNPNTKMVTFEFLGTTGLADYFRMKIWQSSYNKTGLLIIDTQLYTSSGTIFGNLSNYTSGDFNIEVYVSRSPEMLLDFLDITLSELAGTFGILGLFFAFLIVLTIIFGLSFNPVVLTMAVPLSLTLGKLIGILSLSWTPIFVFYLLALLAIGAMSK